jgi:hypothetical protein
MDPDYKKMTDFLVGMGIEDIPHTNKSYLAHLIGVYRFMQAQGCVDDACRGGMFHSVYGTEMFQGFTLPLARRTEVRAMIGERAERLAYLNCAMDRATFDAAVARGTAPHRFRDRITGEGVELSTEDFDDLCRIHLYDWLEQVPRSRWGYGFRRDAYRNMAERLGPVALEAYDRVFAQESVTPPAASSPA